MRGPVSYVYVGIHMYTYICVGFSYMYIYKCIGGNEDSQKLQVGVDAIPLSVSFIPVYIVPQPILLGDIIISSA